METYCTLLNMEHFTAPLVSRPEVSKWFTTNGIYLSIHSTISLRLALDEDGDQLNVVTDETLVRSAIRNLHQYDVYTSYYEMGKAPASPVDYKNIYEGLIRAHKFSGIGQVSNNLTKVWNKKIVTDDDRLSAAWLSAYNNYVIDAAKTGLINTYLNYPEVSAKISKSVGGKRSMMPYFFKYTKNGRRKEMKDRKYAKQNKSTMNRICAAFDDIGNINMNYAGVAPFNWQMLLKNNDEPYVQEAVELFCEIDNSNIHNIILAAEEMDLQTKLVQSGYEFVKEIIIDKFTKKYGSIERVYPSVVKHLFAGVNANKTVHKQMFWRVFGLIALDAIQHNVNNCVVCENCGMRIPMWAKDEHKCPTSAKGMLTCCDCGTLVIRTNSRQIRCGKCQDIYRRQKNVDIQIRKRGGKKKTTKLKVVKKYWLQYNEQ